MFVRNHIFMDQAGASDGTGGGTGGASGTGAAGTGGGDAGAAGTGAGGTGGGASQTPWHGLTEADDIAYVSNKGWKSPTDIYKSYRGAEKLIGKNPEALVELPRADDPASFRALAQRLGMPAEAKDYALDMPKDLQVDEGYLGWARDTFHKVGLTGEQAKQLSSAHNEWLRGQLASQQQDYERNVTADKQTLTREWGAGFERMMNAAKQSANALGFTQEMVDSMEAAIGYGATMKFFAGLGQKMSEDGFEHGGATRGFGDQLTPAEAKAQWDAMKLDPNESKALMDNSHPGHKVAAEKQRKLFKIMYPEK